MKKALLIIAPKDFRDEEYFEPKAILEKAGIPVTTASASGAIARGKLGASVKPDIALSQVQAADYDAVVFVGGNGASVYFDNDDAHRIAQEAAQNRTLLAAICISPVILARAGVLRNKKATVFPGEEGDLAAGGAVYTGNPVEQDGLVITGAGPQAATQFGKAIAVQLTKNP